MQLQDFHCIKHRGGMENCFCFCLSKKITDIWESSYWELFCKKNVLKYVFDYEFEVFQIVKSRDALAKLGVMLKICLFAWDTACSGLKLEDKLKALWEIRYSGKDLHIHWYSFVVFACFLRK